MVNLMRTSGRLLRSILPVFVWIFLPSCLVDGRSARETPDTDLACEVTLDCPDSDLCEALVCVPAPGCLLCPDRPQAVTGCFHGTCYTAFCDAGWHDANGLYQDGCEYACDPTEGGVEICDGLDNDCSGRIDDPFDLQRDPQHCGACDRPCPVPPHAQALCHLSQCMHVCESRWYDVDGIAENGCESQECFPSAGGVEVCDLVDNDCDGTVDEDIVKDQPDSCGPLCEFCQYDHAQALCTQGACALGDCEPDCADLDGFPENGCEYCCTPTAGGVEVCDEIDNDCNGLVDDGLVCDCPTDMVLIESRYCIDRYEASRPDATAASPGSNSSMATSRPGVVPWSNSSLADAAGACLAAGKRLCSPLEWETACRGPDHSIYSYGDAYEPATCNGIDAFCNCGAGSACEDELFCPFAHCYGTCGANFHPVATSSFAQCTNEYGVFDINGNLWERVEGGAGRGGAYNCSDSESLHQCGYVANWGAQALNNFGFRCCCTQCP
ncbi:formylglycine-generating enzyme family protein [Myxococcota bacterium]|nr:formylglycine-generating enzyme family protein [Myxococcota bacterium]